MATLASGVVVLVIALALIRAGAVAAGAAMPVVNLATVLAYGYDKRAARLGRRRLPEITLHFLAAAGGSPAAVAAQKIFRHKTRDWRFRATFWTICAVQIGLLLVFARTRLNSGSFLAGPTVHMEQVIPQDSTEIVHDAAQVDQEVR